MAVCVLFFGDPISPRPPALALCREFVFSRFRRHILAPLVPLAGDTAVVFVDVFLSLRIGLRSFPFSWRSLSALQPRRSAEVLFVCKGYKTTEPTQSALTYCIGSVVCPLSTYKKKYLWAEFALPPTTSSGVDQAPNQCLVFPLYGPSLLVLRSSRTFVYSGCLHFRSYIWSREFLYSDSLHLRRSGRVVF